MVCGSLIVLAISWCCILVFSGFEEFNFWLTVVLWERPLVKDTVPKTNDKSSSVGLTGGVECGRPYLFGGMKDLGRDSLSLGSIKNYLFYLMIYWNKNILQ